jgi:hypothetical protein
MYKENNKVKYICKCGCSQTSHENSSMNDKCICNPQLITSNITSFDYIAPMLKNHIASPIQPFSIIYVNDTGNSTKNTISNIVDNLWNASSTITSKH